MGRHEARELEHIEHKLDKLLHEVGRLQKEVELLIKLQPSNRPRTIGGIIQVK